MSKRHTRHGTAPDNHPTTPGGLLLMMVVVTLMLTCGCATWHNSFDNPRIDLTGLEPAANSASGAPEFVVTLRVVNPNTVDLNIKGLYYEISVEGHEVVTGASNAPSRIPAYGEGIITLRAAPSLLGAIGLISNLLRQGTDKTTFDYQLYTKISLGGQLTPLRIRHRGTLDLNATKPMLRQGI